MPFGAPTNTHLQAQDFLARFDATTLLTTRLAYDTSGNVEYVGQAAPGSAEGDPVWQIRKLVYDGNGNLTAVLFANGAPAFDRDWAGRGAHAYG